MVITKHTSGSSRIRGRADRAAPRGRLRSSIVALGVMLAACSGEFAGATLGEAIADIEARGQDADIDWDGSTDVPPGVVVESIERPDGSVGLRVSARDRVPVPDLVGVDADAAERTLSDLGLEVRTTSEPVRAGPLGVVAWSEPASDMLLEPGGLVSLGVRELERNTIVGALVLAADKDQLGAETLPTDDGTDSEDWLARGPSFAGERCWGRGLYSDIIDGAPFVVRDAAGTIVAKGELGRGRAVYVGEEDATLAVDTDWDCHFTYRIEGVTYSDFYAIETVRNTLTYAFDELEALDWQVDLTIPFEGPPDLR